MRRSPTKTTSMKNKKDPYYTEGQKPQYGCSRVTGFMRGGYFWNPPLECTERISIVNEERWVDTTICGKCKTKPLCEISRVSTNLALDEYDKPSNRKVVSKRRS